MEKVTLKKSLNSLKSLIVKMTLKIGFYYKNPRAVALKK